VALESRRRIDFRRLTEDETRWHGNRIPFAQPGNLSGSVTEGGIGKPKGRELLGFQDSVGRDQGLSDTSKDLKQTPLAALHQKLGGKMVPFAGYEMPVQFPAGIMAEHNHTRLKASLFDVSHMGQAVLRGDDVAAAMEALVPADLQALPLGKTGYTMLTDENGGIIDDLMIANHGDHLHLVVNASRKEVDFAHIAKHLAGRGELDIREDRALIALQGPKAADVLSRFIPDCTGMKFLFTMVGKIEGVPCFISRLGYTGEDGYELSVPANGVVAVAEALLGETEVDAAGLGARDSLRLEAGLALYGNDIDLTTTPVEANLAWTIGKRRRAEGGFLGAEVILKQLAEGTARLKVGIKPDGRAPAREHTKIQNKEGRVIGEITSGGFGPTVGGPVAMGYVETAFAETGTEVDLMVRGKALPGKVAALPFAPHRYFRG